MRNEDTDDDDYDGDYDDDEHELEGMKHLTNVNGIVKMRRDNLLNKGWQAEHSKVFKPSIIVLV